MGYEEKFLNQAVNYALLEGLCIMGTVSGDTPDRFYREIAVTAGFPRDLSQFDNVLRECHMHCLGHRIAFMLSFFMMKVV